MSRSGDDGIEDAFTAKEHIFYPGNGLNVYGTGGSHGCQMTGVYNDLLSGLEFVFYHMAVEFCKDGSIAADTLHNKSLSAKQTGS